MYLTKAPAGSTVPPWMAPMPLRPEWQRPTAEEIYPLTMARNGFPAEYRLRPPPLPSPDFLSAPMAFAVQSWELPTRSFPFFLYPSRPPEARGFEVFTGFGPSVYTMMRGLLFPRTGVKPPAWFDPTIKGT